MYKEITSFLKLETPGRWVKAALENIEILLIDHAHCEKKAASTALSLIFQYSHFSELLIPLSRLAREELKHFEQVLKLIKNEGFSFKSLPPSRYASALNKKCSVHDPERLIDKLLIAAIIEARSCERFYLLKDGLPKKIGTYYSSLFAAEARHFTIYLDLAHKLKNLSLKIGTGHYIEERLLILLSYENDLILREDPQLRMHSGFPSSVAL